MTPITPLPRPPRGRVAWAGQLALAGFIFLALLLTCKPFSRLEDYTSKPLVDPAGVLQVYPWHHFNMEQFRAGHFPLWNPYSALGEPHLANIQTAAFFPLYWPWYALGGGAAAYGALLLLRLWLAAMFWFVFARAKLCSFSGALVVGAAYAFGAYGLWFIELVDLNSQMLLPLLLLALPKLALRPRIADFCWSTALVSFAIIGGHPEAAFVTLFVAGLYTLAAIIINRDGPHSLLCGRREAQDAGPSSGNSRLRLLQRSLLALTAAGITGLLISSAVSLPFINYLSRCWTMHGPGFGFFHLDPRAFFNLIVPGIHTVFKNMPREIPVQYINYGALSMLKLPYSATGVPGNLPGAGLVVCGLALYAVIRLRRLAWPAAFFAGLLALLLGLTLGLPGFRLIALIPPFNMNANFKFFFSEISACLAVLAGVGLEAMWALAKDRGDKIRAIVYPVFIALIIIFILEFFTSYFWGKVQYNNFGLATTYLYLGLDGPLLIFILLFMQLKKVGARRIAHGLFLIFICSSLIANAYMVMPYLWLQKPEREMIKALHLSVDLSPGREERIDGLEGFWPANLATLDGFKDVRSSDALFYKPYVDLINRINGLTAQESLGYFYPSYFTQPSPEKLEGMDTRKLSVAWIVSNIRWVPSGIIDHIIFREKGVYGVWPPARNVIHMPLSERPGEGDLMVAPYSVPCLFLHAPAMVNFRPSKLSGRQPVKRSPLDHGTLSFMPKFRDLSPTTDGAIFQVINIRSSGPALLYSRYIDPRRRIYLDNGGHRPDAEESTVLLDALEISDLQLSTHPGPNNNRDGDWSAFAALSWNDGPYIPPPEPIWTNPDQCHSRPFIYEVPHLPWAYLEDKKPLGSERAAGDEVAVELDGTRGGQLTVNEAWYPGWKVEIDGKDGVIGIPNDKVSWEAPIPEGAKRAVFRFEPYDFRIGLYGTLATCLVCLGAWFFKRR